MEDTKKQKNQMLKHSNPSTLKPNLGAFIRLPFPLFFAKAYPATKKDFHSFRFAIIKYDWKILNLEKRKAFN
ncbi:hypothetical protein [Chryseobacterium sp. FH1]|uniref:hypothetical protein n=1 Tax=Chryseobacterium sp. FH1 TaxID=1233951 RepID=UPI0004E37E73|nr:hypothetical protein [Chryseobacterium sp. FH1]KFC19399.1 hypothetical protein IO90_08870 [Chryseobacterium sp. FH1]